MAIDEGQIQGKFRGKPSICYNIIKPLENLGEVIEEDSHLVISSYLWHSASGFNHPHHVKKDSPRGNYISPYRMPSLEQVPAIIR